MKVLIFANTVPCRYSAYEILLEEICAAARKNGDLVVPVLGGHPAGDVAEKWRTAGMQWHVASGWTDTVGCEHPWVFPSRARESIHKHKPDVAVVHFGNELPAIAAKLLCRGKIRWVWEQDQQIKDPAPVSTMFSRIGMVGKVFDHMVAMYEGGRRSLAARGIADNRISVIHNSIRDKAGAAVDIKKELGLSHESILLFSTSSLIRRKRVDFLINVLRDVLETQKREVHLIVAGEGGEREALIVKAKDADVSEHVHFLGMRPDARSILPAVDIYVHASTAEACTYAVTEALCSATPVVMTEAGAAREQVEDGVSGYVLGKDDLDGFVERLIELINDPAKRQSMGEAGRERWRQMFRVEDAARKYVELYRELAS